MSFPFHCDSKTSDTSVSFLSAAAAVVALKGVPSTPMERLTLRRRRKKQTREEMFSEILQPVLDWITNRGPGGSVWLTPGEGKSGEEKGPGISAGKGEADSPGSKTKCCRLFLTYRFNHHGLATLCSPWRTPWGQLLTPPHFPHDIMGHIPTLPLHTGEQPGQPQLHIH